MSRWTQKSDELSGTGRTTRMLQNVVQYLDLNSNRSVCVVVLSDEQVKIFKKELIALGADIQRTYIEPLDGIRNDHRLTTKFFWDHKAIDELEKRQIEAILARANELRTYE